MCASLRLYYKSLLPLSCPKQDKRPRKGRKTGKTRKDQGSRLHMKVSKMWEMDRCHLRQRTAIGLFMLVRFYFHDVEEQLKATIHTNFCSKWILSFVTDCLNICKLFRDAAFTFSYHHAEFTAVTYYI